MVECLADRLQEDIKHCQHMAACENCSNVQDELLCHPHAPKCLFKNIREFFMQDENMMLNKLKENKVDVTFDHFLPIITEFQKQGNETVKNYVSSKA
eukprot:8242441-Karenia_brevis.AAC.1